MKGQGEKASSAHSAQNDGAKSSPSENVGGTPAKRQQIPRRPRAGLARDDNVGLCRAEEPGATFTPQAKTHPQKTWVGHPENESRSLVGRKAASLGMTTWGCAGLKNPALRLQLRLRPTLTNRGWGTRRNLTTPIRRLAFPGWGTRKGAKADPSTDLPGSTNRRPGSSFLWRGVRHRSPGRPAVRTESTQSGRFAQNDRSLKRAPVDFVVSSAYAPS
jgi:hypothetical protein